MKKFLSLLMIASGLLVLNACQRSLEDNHPLQYEQIDVNFSATLAGTNWTKEDLVGVFANCTRNGEEHTVMSEKFPACFRPTEDTVEGQLFNLVKCEDEDNILSLKSDHNFMFYAIAPYDPQLTDVTKIPVDVPATVNFVPGMKAGGVYVAKNKATSVVAPVSLSFSSTVVAVKLRVPDAIVNEEGGTVLRSLVIRPYNESKFNGQLSFKATYNLATDELTPVAGTQKKTITIDFGEQGTALTKAYTDVCFLAAPFVVPEEGFELVFTDVDGKENAIPFLNKKSGTEYPAGSSIVETVSTSSDGVIPCTSPVLWPIGYKDDAPINTAATQPKWKTEENTDYTSLEPHIWTCSAQPQATITYVFGENHPKATMMRFELNNFSQYNYSAPCIKGLWPGDYLYIDVPVKKFAAGTTVTLTIPSYSRGGALFWDVEYLDGEEWKCHRQTYTSPDGNFTRECTVMFEHGNKNGAFEGITYKVDLPYTKAIKSGHLYIRLKVSEGDNIVTNPSATYATTCYKKTAEDWAARDKGAFLFAFVNKSGNTAALSVEWN